MIKNAFLENTENSPEALVHKGIEPSRRFCVAPMMEWTTPQYRYLARLLSRHTLLYTEMVTTGALIHGDTERFLRHNSAEYPLALQLGGSDAGDLAHCARLAEQFGFSEVNLNVGCPSDRVQNNMIGACLMAHPDKVAQAVRAMIEATHLPVTVKHRIGINGRESWDDLCDFVEKVSTAGCRTFIVHARIAVLEGLSPKENRDVPPLKYDWAYGLKQKYPHLEIIINGGIKTFDECHEHLQHTDGVMLGREAYHNPWLLAGVDSEFFGDVPPTASRHDTLRAMYPFIQSELERGVFLGHISRHVLGLFHGVPGGRQFRRYISENAHKPGAGLEVIQTALENVQEPAQTVLTEAPSRASLAP
ncbi:MAG TPA: tRNA dihydrouridine(20/20a) synthase DusA [Marinobacter sp.]|uniref:tRNA-dihydrouridine(20/20a) synthase n=1 Tax=Marinobacter antarcticus TaxID=564117 RepID=A0A831R1S4_9GAMM|nr:tRNA dihydrouridine(20/20a) synthase DusA [Marinobacter antarcticus]HDZ38937.1 tRNA dihydrouridine(20/20a) synthase DusA [Marinobacter sp.]HEA51282.1 tRNA dihydrouridine(20/20a) synthase DusA [Marinobacter antarcticus]